ncbi:YdiU family protein [Methylibium sp.]|uniref:protein adenylyltransferase SelO n=1 Tax=Methylibium sp. TaxID=2067992 RepID=UPI001797892F|nr:YdiU family protein [Methylibium sp.]MBA3589351.1 YdiU family protein [Methylibium sp.]
MTALHFPLDLQEDVPAPPLRWLNRYARLGPSFSSLLPAQAVPQPHWVARSDDLAAELGWPDDWAERSDWRALQVLAGATPWHGAEPLASVYSGHQFGVWAGQLGDGRALLLGEIDTPAGPMELQLKGSGMTPYSRMGDGRAVLRSSIREFLCSEAMHHLGIPTTRALAVVGSKLPVRRETIETAAVVMRVAPSFLRFGHFEHFAHHDQPASLRVLADYAIERYYPDCADAPNAYAALLEAVARRTATLIADWQAVGFCHGVMNTDNMSLLGLTIDYGPFGFLDGFDPGHICNHSDHQGRYAYARQPGVALWNLHALAQALLPLIAQGEEVSEATGELALEAIEPYRSGFAEALQSRMRAKLGFATVDDGDPALIDDWLKLLAAERTDFTIAWRRLAGYTEADPSPVRDLFLDRAAFDAWAVRYAVRLRAEASVDAERAQRMNRVNPKFVLRNHLCENAIRAAQGGDFEETARLLKVLQRPFDEQPEHAADADFPPDWAQTLEVSCSS